MDVRREKDTLETFKRLLISRHILNDREAETYFILINLGQATAADIHRKLILKPEFRDTAPQTVHKFLETLRTNGFVKVTASSGKRGHSKLYKANSPESALALEKYFDDTDSLKDVMNDVVAVLEINNQKANGSSQQGIWVHEPQKTALREGVKCLRSAKKSVIIYSNNYSWIVEEPSIGQILMKKIEAQVEVRLLGSTPKDTVRNSVSVFDNVRKETDIPCMPYCIVDGQELLLILNESFNAKLFATQNGYMVDHFASQFEKIWNNHSKGV